MTTSVATRIARLRAEIRRHDRKYYDEAAAEISDREYDRLSRNCGSWKPAIPT